MVDMPNIVCEGCGKKYRWKPELAGKKVKCKCGQVLEIPDPPQEDDPNDDSFGAIELADVGESSHAKPAPPKPSKPDKPASPIGEVKIAGGDIEPVGLGGGEDDEADDSGNCPSCGQPLAIDAVLCIQCGFNRNTGKKIGTVGEMEGDEAGDGATSHKLHQLKQWKIPVAMVVIGLGVNLMFVMSQGAEEGVEVNPAVTLIGMLIGTGLGVVLMVGAAFLAAPLLDTTFGDIRTAILKLAAVYVTPGVLMSLVSAFMGDWQLILGLPVLWGSYFGLLVWLFDFDFFEAAVFAIIGWLIKYWIIGFILAMLLY
ncbi:hypothetical protein HED60_11965 [Planctomycetales bacterium ZRK34]|nr:hypothetical protein HED60_11965 [Planctomycetales bacterium ZRK34]